LKRYSRKKRLINLFKVGKSNGFTILFPSPSYSLGIFIFPKNGDEKNSERV